MHSAIVWNNILLFSGFVLLISCAPKEEQDHTPTPYHLDIPAGFSEMKIPADNPMTVEAVELGHRLFFDPILSKDYSISCASCHLPSHAFADTTAVSRGVHQERIGNRNSPSLANVGYLNALFMEGGVPSLELQVLAPLGERNEMDLQLTEAVARLNQDSSYVQLAKKAYNREIDPWLITRALAAYQRSLISGNSPFDQYAYQGKEDAISQEAKNGWLRFQAFNCNACHTGFMFTNQGYFNIGLEEEYSDPGRGRLTDKPEDHGKFRVPSLRNVAVTAPYMHDGSLKSLSEVIDHFASGGKSHENKSPLISGFKIDEQGKKELIAFLESLTDQNFIQKHEALNVTSKSNR
jgi:cytochrome c peroxidase